jgi:hypothetical protein
MVIMGSSPLGSVKLAIVAVLMNHDGQFATNKSTKRVVYSCACSLLGFPFGYFSLVFRNKYCVRLICSLNTFSLISFDFT